MPDEKKMKQAKDDENIENNIEEPEESESLDDNDDESGLSQERLIPLDAHIKERDKLKKQIREKNPYYDLAKRLEEVTGKSVDTLMSEVENLSRQGQAPQNPYQPPRYGAPAQSSPAAQSPKVGDPGLLKKLEELEGKMNRGEMKAEIARMTAREEYRSLRGNEDKIISLALDSGLPIRNAAYALYGDKISKDTAHLSKYSEDSTPPSGNLPNFLSDGGDFTPAKVKLSDRERTFAKQANMTESQYLMSKSMRDADPDKIAEYYKNRNKKK